MLVRLLVACELMAVAFCFLRGAVSKAAKRERGGWTDAGRATTRRAKSSDEGRRMRGGQQGTSGRLWEFLPDRTWAEILSFLWPDMVAGISGQTEKPTNCFFRDGSRTFSPVCALHQTLQEPIRLVGRPLPFPLLPLSAPLSAASR